MHAYVRDLFSYLHLYYRITRSKGNITAISGLYSRVVYAEKILLFIAHFLPFYPCCLTHDIKC